ncbi:transglutaminase domain-containing protein [Hyalangium rubrum]|uniref:Transglutaminase domain-containing protein n=1 Tax=Hyalangium rubrum TaxID=3103134 RepID=A0ABU5HCL6_9BACT|nr:transglutaminase domain-containing protein [Hyalangium sp. s54d21]MDY7231199.1 transglutaminase domain-containing protein [Hyalangium sp. s54d21]
MRPPPRRSSGPGLLSWLLILGVLGVAVALPLLGAWVASTLAIHHGAPVAWSVAAGLGLGLGLPLLWEVWSLPRRQQGRPARPRWLRLRTRLLLRTWAVNLVFLAGALLLSPRGVFTALSTRGDWMLPPSGGPVVETARRLLFVAADGVEWAYVLATDNPYRDQLIATAPRPPPPPARPAPFVPPVLVPPVPVPPPSETPAPQPIPPTDEVLGEEDPLEDSDAQVIISWKTEPRPPEPEPEVPAKPTEPKVDVRGLKSSWQNPGLRAPSGPAEKGGAVAYPLPDVLHPRVASLPRSVETDLVSVAKYLVEGESDPFQRVKALHDYVADRVEYDVPAYRAMKIPPQPPEAVFERRRAVCAGYANLFAAMGRAVGEEVFTLSGEAIKPGGEKELESHAWNAVRINGDWYLVDVTWNAGSVGGDLFTRRYRTKYLFMPPQEFLQSHLPEDAGWQLLDVPLERGEILRQARESHVSRGGSLPARTETAAEEKREWEGIRILQPPRPLEEVRGRFIVEIDNPKRLPTEISLLNLQDGSKEDCFSQSWGTRYSCSVPRKGLYRIQVFAGPQTPPKLMAQLEVQGTN